MTIPERGLLSRFPRAGGLLLCFGCQSRASCRLGVNSFRPSDADSWVAELTCPADQASGPDIAHGGWVASVLDEVVGLACVEAAGLLAVTAQLHLDYHRPTPVDRPLRITARVDGHTGDHWRASGTLLLAESGAPLASANGIWVARRRRSRDGDCSSAK